MNTNIWFFSDPHYGHKNIAGAKVSNWSRGYRDFDSVYEMNERLVESINAAAKKNDIIYCLGDWAFGGRFNIQKFRSRINCETIYLILGNHDKHIRRSDSQYRELFAWVKPSWEGKILDRYFVLNHYAQKVWNHSHHGSIHLYGHSHGSLPDDPNSLSFDVGWETCLFGHEKYTLYHYDEVISIIDNHKTWSPIDHHTKETNE